MEWKARLRRSAFSRWIVDLKIGIDHLRWKFFRGRRQALSAIAKRRMILDELRSHNLRTIVETGTFLGDTTDFLSSRGYRVITLEVDPLLARLARARFDGRDNVRTIEGDSAKQMPKLVAELERAALFFLDGHYSGSGTGMGDQETPVVDEVEAILAGARDGSFVIIDDARCFGGRPDYPPLTDFLTLLRNRGVGDAVVKDDNIRFSVQRRAFAAPSAAKSNF
jgi:predicted O-methyltransferase YrrM